ncbi:hypothetical protein SeMB42_g03742 [Synchytrium endobioticum]|uniref:Uncharacterized protein n=1 Tax=Synchytrium endobioticum TaxID=286115 RepID=A0A507D4T8_9FUNG|nr:hypothetical protein SeMB42_g03742 [Synchytrium endobioticum]
MLKVSPKVVEFDHDKYEEPKKVPEAKAGEHSSKGKAKRAPSGRSSRTKAADDYDYEGPETSKKNFSDATRAIMSYDIAHAYYSTKKYKRKRWDADKVKRGELERLSTIIGEVELRAEV